MAREFKVCAMRVIGRAEYIVAYQTKKELCELLKVSLPSLNRYASLDTHNPAQVQVAMSKPKTVFVTKEGFHDKNFQAGSYKEWDGKTHT